jgi:Ca-activated chloride channel family protein
VSGKAFSGDWGVAIPLAGSRENPGIAALWARARIEALVDAERAGADSESTRRAIVETALAHHLVSPHTSLVAVDKTPVADADTPLATERVPNLLPYGQSVEAIFGLPATATPQALHLAVGATALLLGGFLWLTVRRVNPGIARHAPARS